MFDNDTFFFMEKKWAIFTPIWQQYSTIHALIHLTDKMRNENDNYSCEIFANFWKAFAIVDHHILLKKIEQYGIRRNSTKRFASYHNNRLQSVLINGINSNQVNVK